MRPVTWYFDFVSPFAYLCLHRLRELPAGVAIEYRPVLFAGLLGAKDMRSPRFIPFLPSAAQNSRQREATPTGSLSFAVVSAPKSNGEGVQMHQIMRFTALSTFAMLVLGGCAMGPSTEGGGLTFFVTSVGPGKGGDLRGLEGADRHCQTLASAAGAGHRTWRAYLSTQGSALNDPKVVHARDRIGSGPWHNAKGVRIARNVDELHSASNNLTKETALDEKGQMVNGRTEKPNKHDILTGSRPDGTAFPGQFFPDMTCGNWTKSGADGSAMTGHHDRAGPIDHPWGVSWNSSHPTLGCTQDGIRKTGGDGLFYCFATK